MPDGSGHPWTETGIVRPGRKFAAAHHFNGPSSWVDVRRTAPPNPPEFIQRKFVGVSYHDAYSEAATLVATTFELLAKHTNAAGGRPGRVVDFGSGWGRISRFLADRVAATSIFAVDVDPEMTALVNVTLPGVNAMTTTPAAQLHGDRSR